MPSRLCWKSSPRRAYTTVHVVCMCRSWLVANRTHPCSFSSSWSHSHNLQSTRIQSLPVCWRTCPVRKGQERCGTRRCLKVKRKTQTDGTLTRSCLDTHSRQTTVQGRILMHKADLWTFKKWSHFTSFIEVVNYVTIIEPKGNKTVRSVAESSEA